MNPNYEQIGKTFVQQYYAIFDTDAAGRAGLANFYSVSSVFSFCPVTDCLFYSLPGRGLHDDVRGSANDGKEGYH